MSNAIGDGAPHATLNDQLTSLLKGKTVSKMAIHNVRELVVFFEDGTRLFVDAECDLRLSVT
ncbi:MAG: hypothetical protein AAFU86_05840 [Pseudomonadota bacterium]